MTHLPFNKQPVSPFLSVISPESIGIALGAILNSPGLSGGTGWPTANLARYIPFSLSRAVTIQTLWIGNGSSIAGNVDIGIYSVDGTRITHTGSTAQTGTTVLQGINITPITIGPGQYYLALALSSTSALVITVVPSAAIFLLKTMGCFQQATAFPLPATATFATNTTTTNIPFFGAITLPATVL